MKLLIIVGVAALTYFVVLTQTSNIVFNQLKTINANYQYVANHADQLATGRSEPSN